MISTEHKKVLSDILYRTGLFYIITFFFADNRFWLKIYFVVTYGNAEYREKRRTGRKK